LTVIDVDAFLKDKLTRSSLKASIANLLALTEKQVDIVTITAAAGKGRRMTSGPGKVNVKYTIADVSKTVTPAKVASIAMMLPASVNNQLNAQSQTGNTFVSTATMLAPTLRTTTTTTTTLTTIFVNPNPCAVVAPPVPVKPVKPVKPAATGWGWKATLFKINKDGGEMVKSLYPDHSWVPVMFCLAVPALIGFAVLARNVVRRRATRSMGEGFIIFDSERGLECELSDEEGAEAWD